MAQIQVEKLINLLNSYTKKSLEAAVGLCKFNGNGNIELEHWFLKMLEDEKSDIPLIIDYFKLDKKKVLGQLTRAVELLRTGETRPPLLSPQIFDAVREAWLVCSIDFTSTKIRSGYLLLAMLTDRWLKPILSQLSADLSKISPDDLKDSFQKITGNSLEVLEDFQVAENFQPAGKASDKSATAGGPKRTPALDQFTIDFTDQARDGKIDPIAGRDDEIRQIIDILMRRRQNNPVIVGEAGVGKTAVVEGFALRIANQDVPPPLRNVAVKSLDLGLLQAGASVRGELENRLRGIIQEVKSSPTPIILFIDEAHLLIGMNDGSGMGEAANLLKPALARGELRTIAATTWSEYKQYFEKDAAMVRRFQLVKVEEPSEDKAIQMIRGLVPNLEKHHQVEIRDDGAQAAVRLSKRYLPERQLPDKAVSVLDTTCARVYLSQSATPAAIEESERHIDQLSSQIKVTERLISTGEAEADELEALKTERDTWKQKWESLTNRWKEEETLVQQILDLRKKLQGSQHISNNPETNTSLTPDEREKFGKELADLKNKLSELQGEKPLVKPYVDEQSVADVIAAWTGVPVGRMMSNEIQMVLKLEDYIRERVVGQDHALSIISQQVRISRANLLDPTRPTGVFMLVGPSGVGKTETGMALAELLYGGKQNLTIINMSEFKEEHKVSMLTGAPAGYVGYGKGGVLTEAVRRHPYSVLLLDEFEKANPGVHDIFYQVFDKGMLRDGEGRDIDFKNTLIILTSNAASDVIANLCADPETAPSPEALKNALHESLLKVFKPAFLGRLNIIPYYPLSKEILSQIARIQLGKVGQRIKDHYDAKFVYTDDVVKMIVDRCNEVDSGARLIQQIINNRILPELSQKFLTRDQDTQQELTTVELSVNSETGDLIYTLT